MKLAYNYADWALSHQAHQYLSLSPAAEERLQADIKAYLVWHRKEMLPEYSALCRKLAVGFRGEETTEDNIRLVTPMLSGVWADTVEPVIEPVARALVSLDENGLARLEKAYADDSERQRAMYLLDPAAAQKRRVDKTLGYVRDFAGQLSKDQEALINQLTLAVNMPYESWVTDRERRKRDLIELLREHKSQMLVEAALRDWWLRPRVGTQTAKEGQMDPAEVKAFFLGVMKILTVEQKQHAAAVIENYAKEFDELSAEVSGPQLKPTAAPNPTLQPSPEPSPVLTPSPTPNVKAPNP